MSKIGLVYYTALSSPQLCSSVPNRKVLLPTGMKMPTIPDPGRESFFFAPIRRTRTFFNFRSLFFPNFLSQCHSHYKSHESIDSGTDSHYPMELMSYSHEWREWTVNSFPEREWTQIFFASHELIDLGIDSHYAMELMSYSHIWREYTVNSLPGRELTKFFFFIPLI